MENGTWLKSALAIIILIFGFFVLYDFIDGGVRSNMERSPVDANIERSVESNGMVARYVDRTYGVICYNTRSGVSCVKDAEVRR